MMMRKVWTAGLVAAVLLVAGCGFPKDSREKAEWFFEAGHEKIVDSLEDQGVEGEEMERVKAVLADHRSAIIADLAAAFSDQRASFKTLYSGSDTEALLAAEGQSHRSKRAALRSIGRMHADIEQVVGAQTWAAANEQRRKRFEDKHED